MTEKPASLLDEDRAAVAEAPHPRRPSVLQEIRDDFWVASVYRFHPAGRRSFRQSLAAVWDVYWGGEATRALFRHRVAVWLRRYHVPLLPWLLDRWNRLSAGVAIGKPVALGPGTYLPHGNVVIDGLTTIGRGCVFSPFVTVGLSTKSDEEGRPVLEGPTIGSQVAVGTGAKILGPVHIGDGARIGANAVVVGDVPAGATAVGVPAHVVEPKEE